MTIMTAAVMLAPTVDGDAVGEAEGDEAAAAAAEAERRWARARGLLGEDLAAEGWLELGAAAYAPPSWSLNMLPAGYCRAPRSNLHFLQGRALRGSPGILTPTLHPHFTCNGQAQALGDSQVAVADIGIKGGRGPGGGGCRDAVPADVRSSSDEEDEG